MSKKQATRASAKAGDKTRTESSPYDQLKQQAAQQTGEDAGRINLVALELDALLKNGVLVDIDATGLSIFSVKAPWEVWGVPESSARRARLTSGSLYTFSREVPNKLRSMAQAACNALKDHYGHKVPGLPGYLVLYTAYQAWREDFDQRVQEFNLYVNLHVLQEYDEQARKAEREIPRMAREAFLSLRAQDGWLEIDDTVGIDVQQVQDLPAIQIGDRVRVQGTWLDGKPRKRRQKATPYRTFLATEVETVGEKVKDIESDNEIVGTLTMAGSGLNGMTLDQFTTNVMQRVRAARPSKQAIQDKVKLTYTTAALINPSVVEEEMARCDELRRAREMAWEADRARQAEAAEKRRVAEAEEDAKVRETMAKARQAELEVEQKQRLLDDMRKAELAHYREQLQQMSSPVVAIMNDLRAKMYKGAQAVLKSLNGKRANAAAVRAARGMVESFKLLNGLDDNQLEALVAQVDQLVNQSVEFDAAALETAMQEITDFTAEAVTEIELSARHGGRWRGLKVSD